MEEKNAKNSELFSWTFKPEDLNDNVNFMEAILKAEPTVIELRNIDTNSPNNTSVLNHIFSPENQWLSAIEKMSISSSDISGNEDILIDALASPTCRRFALLTDLSLDLALPITDLRRVYYLLRSNMDEVSSLTITTKFKIYL